MRWRAVGYGLLTDYVALVTLVGIGGAAPGVSGFYALLAPARLAPVLAGMVAGAVASESEPTARVAARTGVVHAGAVVGVVFLGGALAAVATTPAGPLLAPAVVAAGVVVWRRRGERWRVRVPLVAVVLVGAVVTLSGRLRAGTATLAEGAVLVPRIGAFAFLGPVGYGRGWTLLGVWVVLVLLGGVLGAVLVGRRPGVDIDRGPTEE